MYTHVLVVINYEYTRVHKIKSVIIHTGSDARLPVRINQLATVCSLRRCCCFVKKRQPCGDIGSPEFITPQELFPTPTPIRYVTSDADYSTPGHHPPPPDSTVVFRSSVALTSLPTCHYKYSEQPSKRLANI